MEQQQLEIREQQKASWNKFSPGWKKWDNLVMDFLKPMGDEIISLLNPHGAQYVLDIAAGTGEPGLTIATKLQGGKVMITDLAEDMLKVAREKAAKRGITNIDTKACDVCELPFDDNTFDSISCRMGFMFFPDMLLAAKEMLRVLKPGGKIATSVWNGPDKNFWVTATMSTINRNLQLPPPPAGAPGMFRCAQPGVMQNVLEQAGFKNISEREVPGKMNAGTLENYWSFQTEVAAPIVAALSNTTDEMREKIRSEVFEIIRQKYPNGELNFDCSAQVIYAEK